MLVGWPLLLVFSLTSLNRGDSLGIVYPNCCISISSDLYLTLVALFLVKPELTGRDGQPPTDCECSFVGEAPIVLEKLEADPFRKRLAIGGVITFQVKIR